MTAHQVHMPTTLADVVARVGSGLLRPLTTSAALLARPVTGVCIYDAASAGEDALPGELLLGVGVQPTVDAVTGVLDVAAARGLAAVVVRTSRPLPATLAARAEERGTALLVAASAPWAHLAAILRAAMVSGWPASSQSDHPALGDLFAFANDVARSVSGAVTIEDPSYRVLAYSSIHGDVDEPRKQTILGRAVPGPFVTLLHERGILQALRSTGNVVPVEPVPEIGLGPRWAVGIRAAGEFLGSVWLARSGGDLAEGFEATLREAAGTAALHLLHNRLELQSDQTRAQDVSRELLAGGAPADLLASSAGLRLEDVHRVVVLESRDAVPSRARMTRAVATYWATLGRRGLVVEQGPRVYAIVSASRAADLDGATGLRIATDAARHAARATGVPVLAAFGSCAGAARDIADSRRQADSALRVLRHGMVDGAVTAWEDVRSQVTLLDLVDLVHQHPELHEGKVRALVEADRGAVLVPTLAAYLDCFGDVRAAADRLGVHQNTFRYRLRRLQEQVGLDLSDPAERIVAALQLRALPVRF